MSASNAKVIDVLRATLLEVQQSEGVSPDDPALMTLKSIVLRLMAELEVERSTNPTAAETSLE